MNFISNLNSSRFSLQPHRFIILFSILFKNYQQIPLHLLNKLNRVELIRSPRMRCTFWPQIIFVALFSALIGFGESSANVSPCSEHGTRDCVQNLLLRCFQHTTVYSLVSAPRGDACSPWLFSGSSNSVFSPVLLVAAEAELVCTGAVGHQICAPSPVSPAEVSHLNFFWALLAWATAVCCQGSYVLGLLVVTAQLLPALLWVKREGSRWALQSLHIKNTVNLCIFIGWA